MQYNTMFAIGLSIFKSKILILTSKSTATQYFVEMKGKKKKDFNKTYNLCKAVVQMNQILLHARSVLKPQKYSQSNNISINQAVSLKIPSSIIK